MTAVRPLSAVVAEVQNDFTPDNVRKGEKAKFKVTADVRRLSIPTGATARGKDFDLKDALDLRPKIRRDSSTGGWP